MGAGSPTLYFNATAAGDFNFTLYPGNYTLRVLAELSSSRSAFTAALNVEVPDCAIIPGLTCASGSGGATFKLWNGSTVQSSAPGSSGWLDRAFPKLDTVTPSATWVATTVSSYDSSAILMLGSIRIATPGKYTFWVFSKDAERLYIDGVVPCTSGTASGWNSACLYYVFMRGGGLDSATVTLTAGYHSIRGEYYVDGGREASWAIEWSGPDTFYERKVRLLIGTRNARGQMGQFAAREPAQCAPYAHNSMLRRHSKSRPNLG